MKVYCQDEFVTIYHGDCREILPQLAPEAFGLNNNQYAQMVKDGKLPSINLDLKEKLHPRAAIDALLAGRVEPQ